MRRNIACDLCRREKERCERKRANRAKWACKVHGTLLCTPHVIRHARYMHE